ncbi:MAG: SIMPL domain-containing protein [Patescibacteria group bacterium]
MPVKPVTSDERYSHRFGEFTYKIFLTLFGILLVYLIVLLGTVIRNNLEKYYYIGQAEKPERMITLDAEGKVTVAPDVSMTTMGMIAKGKTVAEAQEKNSAVMNALIERLKGLGVEEKDIQTANYNIYPQYNYTEAEGQVLTGYEVHQSVMVKIRDVSRADTILGLAGEVGANAVSGLQFTFDDDEAYKAEARQIALEALAEKARAISEALGVRMIGIVSYAEYEGGRGGYPPPMPFLKEMEGIGGAAPDIEAGSQEVVMNVSVTFEIR